MNAMPGKMLFWTPRVLAALFAAFISIFALDVFDEGRGFSPTVAAQLIHLIPTYLVIIALALAWRWEWTGAVLFTGLAVAYVVMFWGRFPWPTYLIIAGPLAVLGILFLFNWIFRARSRAC